MTKNILKVFFFIANFAIYTGMSPSKAAALDWQLLDPSLGQGYGTCQMDGAGYACLALVCRSSEEEWSGFKLVLLRNQVSEVYSRSLLYRIDETPIRSTFVNPPRELSGYDFSDRNALAVEFLAARQVEMWQDGYWVFGLDGFGLALDIVLRECPDKDSAAIGIDDLREAVAYRAEQNAAKAEEDFASYSRDWIMNAPVFAEGPATGENCVRQCFATPNCTAATIARPNQCRLHSGYGSFRHAPGALTAIVENRRVDRRPPAIAGTAPQVVTGLQWQTGDTAKTYLDRLRAAARPFGADCKLEAAAVDAIVPQLQIMPPGKIQRVGVPFQFGWKTGARLSSRVPTWIMVTADRPIRFTGDHFFALLPGALGPFGLANGADKHRAFVRLHEGTKTQGEVGLIALDGEDLTIEVTVVAWHRACQQERLAARSEVVLNISPGDPQLVLSDPTAPEPYTNIISSPKFDRNIYYGEGRVAIRDSRDGSEILARDGKNPRLSATGRFLVLTDDRNIGANHIEIFDVMDGAKVQDLTADTLVWWNADSFVMTDSQPYGVVQAGAMALPRLLSAPWETGPSCCSSEGRVLVNVDLENGLLGVAENVFDLTDGALLGRVALEGLSLESSTMLGETLHPWAFSGFGLVAPFNAEKVWNMPLGPFGFSEIVASVNQVVPVFQIASPQIRSVPDQDAASIASAALKGTVLRGLEAASGKEAVFQGFELAVARWGVLLAEAQTPNFRHILADQSKFPSANTDQAAKAAREAIKNMLQSDLERVNKFTKWAIFDPESSGVVTYCEYSPGMNDIERAGANPKLIEDLKAEADFDLAYRYDLPAGRQVWILRSFCTGGATGGTLTSVSSLNIYDSARPERNLAQYRVAAHGTFRASALHGDEGFFSIGFASKIVGQRYILNYAPGEAALSVFDLVTRKFVLNVRQSWRGDLLRDVYLDSRFEHLFAFNSDGSFAVYPLGENLDTSVKEQAPTLFGLYLDDELVVWTDDYRFDATTEGAAFVELRFPGAEGQHSLDQLSASRRSPDLMQAVLQGSPLAPSHAPSPPPSLSGVLYRSHDRVVGLLQPKSQQFVQEIRLFIDGRQAATFPMSTQRVLNIDVPLPIGARWATAVAIDAEGQSSRPVGFDLGKGTGGLSRTHFLGVGIDYYSDPSLIPLNFAKTDASNISKTLELLNGLSLDLVTNAVLTDRRASREAIQSQIAAILASAEPGDHVVLHFAGHGLQDTDGNFYLATSATSLDDLAGTALSWAEIARRFQGFNVRITVLLDACHSGAAGTGPLSTNDSSVADIQRRMPPGLTIVAAAKGRQTSGEDAAAGGGIFSSAIARVLVDERSIYDFNKNGVLEAVEFYRGIKTIVTAARGKDQTPWLSRNGAVGEYALF